MLRRFNARFLFLCSLFALGLPPLCVAQESTADRVESALGAALKEKAPPSYVSMTPGQRFKRYFKDVFLNPGSLVANSAVAGFGQWRDSPKEWGEGAQGYGLRIASAYGEHVVRESLIYGSSSVLHEDDRYFRLGAEGGSFKARLKYAAISTVMARRDDGSRCFSISKVSGFAGASMISRIWQPQSTNGPASAASNFASSMGVAVGFNVAREFLPDLFHRK